MPMKSWCHKVFSWSEITEFCIQNHKKLPNFQYSHTPYLWGTSAAVAHLLERSRQTGLQLERINFPLSCPLVSSISRKGGSSRRILTLCVTYGFQLNSLFLLYVAWFALLIFLFCFIQNHRFFMPESVKFAPQNTSLWSTEQMDRNWKRDFASRYGE